MPPAATAANAPVTSSKDDVPAPSVTLGVGVRVLLMPSLLATVIALSRPMRSAIRTAGALSERARASRKVTLP